MTLENLALVMGGGLIFATLFLAVFADVHPRISPLGRGLLAGVGVALGVILIALGSFAREDPAKGGLVALIAGAVVGVLIALDVNGWFRRLFFK